MDFKTEFNKIIGLCYASETFISDDITEKVTRFLESNAPRDLKVRAVLAVFQAVSENKIDIRYTRRLFNLKYRDILIELLNQKDFIDCFIDCFDEKSTSFNELKDRIIPGADQLFSDSTVLYALSRENISHEFVALFSCHPVILRYTALQRKVFESFIEVPSICSGDIFYIIYAYITDEVIDEFELEKQFRFFLKIANYAEHWRLKQIAFSPEKMNNVACLYLVAGDDAEKNLAKFCLKIAKILMKTKIVEHVSTTDPVEFNIDPNRHKAITMDEIINIDSVLAAIEVMGYRNIEEIFTLVNLYLNKRPNKKRREIVCDKLREKLIEIAKESPKSVESSLNHIKEKEKVAKVFKAIREPNLEQYIEMLRNYHSAQTNNK